MNSIIIKHLSGQLERNPDLTEVRCLIADSIETIVEANRYSMTQEAQTHFTNAVGSLLLNITSARQPTKAGLSTAIRDLEQALSALNDRHKRFGLGTHSELITCDMLLDAISCIRARLQTTGAETDRQAPST